MKHYHTVFIHEHTTKTMYISEPGTLRQKATGNCLPWALVHPAFNNPNISIMLRTSQKRVPDVMYT